MSSAMRSFVAGGRGFWPSFLSPPVVALSWHPAFSSQDTVCSGFSSKATLSGGGEGESPATDLATSTPTESYTHLLRPTRHAKYNHHICLFCLLSKEVALFK